MEADGRPTCALEAAPNLKAVVRAYSTEATSGLLVAPECGVRACAGRFGKTNGRRRPFVFNAVPCGPCPSTTLPNLSGSRSAASTMAAFQQCGPIVHVSASLVASPSDFNLLFFVSELYVNEAAWGAHEATEHSKTSVGALIPA